MEAHPGIYGGNHKPLIWNTLRGKTSGWHRFAFHLLLCKHFCLHLCNPRCFRTRSKLCSCFPYRWTDFSCRHLSLPCRSLSPLPPACKSLLYQGVHNPCCRSRSLKRRFKDPKWKYSRAPADVTRSHSPQDPCPLIWYPDLSVRVEHHPFPVELSCKWMLSYKNNSTENWDIDVTWHIEP